MVKKTARKKASKAGGRKTVARKAAGRKASPRKTTKRAASATSRKAAKPAPRGIRIPRGIRRVRRAAPSVSMADVRGAEVRRDIGGVRLEAGRAGQGRVKRMIYPPGYKWSTDTKPHVGTDLCMHAHVGFLVQGRIDVIYGDGCVEVFEAPQIVAVAPGHDGHVVGSESAVLIEFDFENDTVQRFGMPDAHRHE